MASIDQAVDNLVAALNANTLAHGGKPPGAAAAGAGKPAAGKAAPSITAEQVKAAVIGIKDTFDKPTALALIKKHAKCTEIAGIKPSFYAAVMEACEEKMAEQGGEGDEASNNDDEL